MDDVTLTFDNNQFMSALNAITEKFASLEETIKSTGAKADESSGKMGGAVKKSSDAIKASIDMTTGRIVKGMMAATAIMNVAVASAKKMLSNIPEVGKSFQIMGNIITKNLLWPLRKELIPILQKMLNWVRDHRAMFVQWGTVIANIFRALKTIITAWMEALGTLWDRMSASIKRIFGTTLKSVTETLNVILFKVTATGIFLMSMIGNVFDYMAGLLEETEPAIIGIIDALKRMNETLFGGVDKVSALSDVFKVLGSVIRDIVLSGIIAVEGTLDGIATRIEQLSILMNVLKSGWSEGARTELVDIQNAYEKRERKRAAASGDSFISPIKHLVNPVGSIIDSTKELVRAGTSTTKVESTKTLNAPITVHITTQPGADANDISRQAARAIHSTLKSEVEKSGGGFSIHQTSRSLFGL